MRHLTRESEQLAVAKRAALAGGSVLESHYRRTGTVDWTRKAQNDLVTAADVASERAILETIRRTFPKHSVLAEESGAEGEAEETWIIDPLDGTTNFVHGYPFASVSVALAVGTEVVVGAVYDPLRRELFWAERGCGAFVNGEPLRVSGTTRLRDSLLATGFPFRAHEDLDTYLAVFKELFVATSGARRAGSAALDLSYVACGRVDGFWEFYLKPWDTAAGALLVREAGGEVTDLFGGPSFRQAGHILASNGRLHPNLLEHVAHALRGRTLACAPPGHRGETVESTPRLP